MKANVTPRLIVSDADQAIAFYVETMDAKELERFEHEGAIVHAAIELGGSKVLLTEENAAWNNVAPTTLGGSGVILYLEVPDADEVGRKMVAAGATVIFPIADQFYGRREGRLRDPFGHLWIVSKSA